VLALATLAAWLPVSVEAADVWSRPQKTVAKNQKSSTLKFTKPSVPGRRVDTAVRPTVYEGNDLRLAANSEGQARIRSIMVNRGEATDEVRSAQLTGETGAAGSTDASTGTASDSQSPFVDTPEPPATTLEPDALPMPEGLQNGVPETEPNTLRQPAGQQQPTRPQFPAPSQPEQTPPTEFQPQVGPPVTAAPADIPEPSETVMEVEQEKAQKFCADSLQNLRAKTINTLSLEISVTGTEGSDFPFECSIDNGTWHEGRSWCQTTYQWKASALCHKPLYFEDEQTERYGHSFTPCFGPFIAGAHFFTRVPILPYCMGVEPPHECIYALGHYRPGNCAPYMCNPIPWSFRGALFQAGAVTGVAAAIP
jgi:hypothetical protein